MEIRFQCPKCRAVRAANPRLLGRQIQCPQCGAAVLLPTADQIESRQQAHQQDQQLRQALRRYLAQPESAETDLPWRSERMAGRGSSNWAGLGSAAAVEASPWDSVSEVSLPVDPEERDLAEATTDFTRPLPKPRDEIDMTPMVDVTFLLLIFFMITASFSVQKSIQRPAIPAEDPSLNAVERPPEEDPDVVTVQVDEFNAFTVLTSDWDRVVASKQDLIVALNDAHAGDASGSQPSRLIVQAHEDCLHQSVIAALDAGREAQFENFEVTTVEQFD